jgi:hypothetical protein
MCQLAFLGAQLMMMPSEAAKLSYRLIGAPMQAWLMRDMMTPPTDTALRETRWSARG